MTTRSTLTTIVLILFVLLAPAIQADEKITIAVGDWPPYISQDQKHNGVISHIITDVFSDIGIDVTLSFSPWARAYDDTAKGLFSASAVWMHKKEREADFIYSDAVLVEQFVFFHRKDRPFNWQTTQDLTNIIIGGVIASSYGPEIDKALLREELLMDRVIHPQQNFKKLLHNRIDIFPFELNVGHAELEKHFTPEEQEIITYHQKPYLNNSSFLLFPKKITTSQSLLLSFNRSLKKFRASGRYDAYFKDFQQGYYNQ